MKRNNLLLIMFIIFGSCECNQESLEEVLGNPCYIDEYGKIVEISESSEIYKDINVGICSTGKTQRDDNDNLICDGVVSEREEDCNNLDDNCNGMVDESQTGYPLSRPFYSPENTCWPTGICGYAEQECHNGDWVCYYPSSFGKEVCDGDDNDCDGDIDEDTNDDPIFSTEERYVYSGDPDTINIGECRAGYKECVNGVISIRNMRTPIAEICGNGDDDDCDGVTDENEDDPVQNDIVLIIDYSGSMSTMIDIVADALCSWTSQGVLVNSRFAVIAIGYNGEFSNRQMKILTDFTDSGTACQIIRNANTPQSSGGIELQLDATYNASNPNSVNGYVNWTNNNKKVLIFSDEQMQQQFQPTIAAAIEAIVQQCTEADYTIGAFIKYDIVDQSLWVDLTQRCNGFLDYLNNNPQDMIDTLNYWIGTDC